MPQRQGFHDQIKNDTPVVSLTEDYRNEVKTVRDWTNQKKFTMPVLLARATEGTVPRAELPR